MAADGPNVRAQSLAYGPRRAQLDRQAPLRPPERPAGYARRLREGPDPLALSLPHLPDLLAVQLYVHNLPLYSIPDFLENVMSA